MNPVRVGVLGVGAWGEKHARVYTALPEAQLTGVHDADPARAREVAARHGVPAFETADALFAECEAVSIAVPTVHHREAFERAAVNGCHALVEKPLAFTVEDARAMGTAAARHGVRLQVGHVERFNPAFAAALPHLKTPRFIEAHRLALFQARSLDIDVVFDLMIHDLDLVLWRAGAPLAQVTAVGVAVLSENEDIANARLEFENGTVANLTASRVSQDRLRRIRFFQDDAYVAVDLFEKTCEFLRVDAAQLQRAAPFGLAAAMSAFAREKVAVPAGEPLALELAAFLRALHGEGAGAASAEAATEAVRIAAEIRVAMKTRARRWAAHPTAAC
jgi:predicted dehydrogenase